MTTQEKLEVKGPGGMGFSFSGQQMFPLILILLLGSIFGYLFFNSDLKADERSKHTVTAIHEMTKSNERAESTQRAMIFVLSLSQEERQKLNLMKPRELSEMQR